MTRRFDFRGARRLRPSSLLCARMDGVKRPTQIPAQIPHEVEKRRATTLNNPEPKQQVKDPIQDNVAGHRIGPDHALKVETRVQPLGLIGA